jgi:hypothetical protein
MKDKTTLILHLNMFDFAVHIIGDRAKQQKIK